MKKEITWSLVLMVVAVLGCEKKLTITDLPPDYVWVKMDPNSSRTYTAILIPTLNKTYEQIEELEAQNQWLRRSMNKCLEKLEAEKGLEPILPTHHLPLRSDPNLAENYPQVSKPWFVPYEEPNVPSLLEEPDTSVKLLACLMGIRAMSIRVYLDSSTSWIANFEERLKRLDPNQPE